VDLVMAVPSEVRLAANMEQFRYLTLLCLLRREDLRLISVWHPSFLSLLMDALPNYWGSLLNDIHGGSCKDSHLLPSTIRDAFKLRPLPHRARRLRGADPRVPDTLWPSLKVISCWSDGPAQSAAEDLQRRFPNVLVQPKGLLATEAFVTIPFGDSRPVAVCSHFFEFVDGQGKIHLAHELRDGETYEVVVTTGGGLWRYRLQDRIQASGSAVKTPSLRFLGRSGNVSDRFGEKLSEAFVAQAIREASADLPAQPRFVLLAPDGDLPGCRYTLYVEGDVPSELPTRLDTSLRRNPDYAWCRELGQLQAIRLFRIKAGGHRAFVARELSRGRRLGEIKPCYLSNLLGWSQWFKAQEPDGPTRKPSFM